MNGDSVSGLHNPLGDSLLGSCNPSISSDDLARAGDHVLACGVEIEDHRIAGTQLSAINRRHRPRRPRRIKTRERRPFAAASPVRATRQAKSKRPIPNDHRTTPSSWSYQPRRKSLSSRFSPRSASWQCAWRPLAHDRTRLTTTFGSMRPPGSGGRRTPATPRSSSKRQAGRYIGVPPCHTRMKHAIQPESSSSAFWTEQTEPTCVIVLPLKCRSTSGSAYPSSATRNAKSSRTAASQVSAPSAPPAKKRLRRFIGRF